MRTSEAMQPSLTKLPPTLGWNLLLLTERTVHGSPDSPLMPRPCTGAPLPWPLRCSLTSDLTSVAIILTSSAILVAFCVYPAQNKRFYPLTSVSPSATLMHWTLPRAIHFISNSSLSVHYYDVIYIYIHLYMPRVRIYILFIYIYNL